MNASYYLRLQSKQQGMDKILNILAILFQIEPILAQVDQLLLEFSEGGTLASDSEVDSESGAMNEEEFCVENLGKLVFTYQN